MIITKIITYAIDIYDPIGFCTDIESNVKSILDHRLRGRCYQGCFIMEITRILNIGDLIIAQEGSPTYGILSVIFEVQATILAPGDVINGCKMTSRDATGVVLCETDAAKIMIFDSAPFASVTPGQLVSVRVVNQVPTIGATNIAMLGEPMIPARKQKVYSVPGPLTVEQLAVVAPALTRALDELARCKPVRTVATWKFFDDLLYAWRDATPAPGTPYDLRAIAAGEIEPPAWLSRDNRLRLTEPTTCGYESEPTGNDIIIDGSLDAAGVVVALLAEWEMHLRNIRQHIEIYSTPELMKSHQNVWRMYTKLKL